MKIQDVIFCRVDNSDLCGHNFYIHDFGMSLAQVHMCVRVRACVCGFCLCVQRKHRGVKLKVTTTDLRLMEEKQTIRTKSPFIPFSLRC